MSLNDFLSGIITTILKLLPADPFKSVILALPKMEWLGWLNWFVPVSQILAVLTAWTTVIALFYVYQAIARWLKLIQ